MLDASALADWLLQSPGRGPAVATEIAAAGAVHTLDFAWIEVASVVRRKLLAGEMSEARGLAVLVDLADMPIAAHPAAPLTGRVWELRATHSAYNAAYVALAEALDAPLVTTDAGLSRSHGHQAVVKLAG